MDSAMSDIKAYEQLLADVPSQPLRLRILNEALKLVTESMCTVKPDNPLLPAGQLSEEGQEKARLYTIFLFISLGDLMERVALSKITQDEEIVHIQKRFVSKISFPNSDSVNDNGAQHDLALVNTLFYIWGWLLGDPSGCQIENWKDERVSVKDILLETPVNGGVPMVRGLVKQLQQAQSVPIRSGYHQDFRYQVLCEIGTKASHITRRESPTWNAALIAPEGPDHECVVHDLIVAIDGILAAVASFRPPEDKFEEGWIEHIIQKPVEQTPGLFSWQTAPIGKWWRAECGFSPSESV